MPSIYDAIDIGMTHDGDLLVVGGDLGILDVSNQGTKPVDQINVVRDLVYTELRSTPGDWQNNIGLGAGLDDFIGKPNNRQTADAIKDRITLALAKPGLIKPSDLSIRIIPVGIHQLLIAIKVAATPTQNNSVTDRGILVNLLYDSAEGSILPVEQGAR